MLALWRPAAMATAGMALHGGQRWAGGKGNGMAALLAASKRRKGKGKEEGAPQDASAGETRRRKVKERVKRSKQEINELRKTTIEQKAESAVISGNARRAAYLEVMKAMDADEEDFKGKARADTPRAAFGPPADDGHGFVVDPWARYEEGQDAGHAVLPRALAEDLKPHQLDGLRFLWKNVVVADRRFNAQPREPEEVMDAGCIIAHPMGLGKTVLAVTFIQLLMKAGAARTALVVAPKSTMSHWDHDLRYWQDRVWGEGDAGGQGTTRRVFTVPDNVATAGRLRILEDWQREGGVLCLGYEQYVILVRGVRGSGRVDEELHERAKRCLQDPGPDVLVCDEGHLLRNDKTYVWNTLSQIKTRRRVALTGTPLQNHLLEYWTMIEFLRPGFFPKKPFQNYFQYPIERGQRRDAEAAELQLMRSRSYILVRELSAFVQRQDHRILRDSLPAKVEYVVYCPLSAVQKRMYTALLRSYMHTPEVFHTQSAENADDEARSKKPSLLFFMSMMMKLVVNPRLCANFLLRNEGAPALSDRAKAEQSFLKKFSNWLVQQTDNAAPAAAPVFSYMDKSAGYLASWSDGDVVNAEFPEDDASEEAAVPSVPKAAQASATFADVLARNAVSPKVAALLEILRHGAARGEKILVFSQFVTTLNFLEEEAAAAVNALVNDGALAEAAPIWRLDGQRSTADRAESIKAFQAHQGFGVFFISTKAGGMGINLNTAHKCVLVDVSFNPTVDQQALFRLYRYGLTHPVEVIRLVATGTPEAKVFAAGISKDWLARKIVDDGAPSRAYVRGVGLADIFAGRGIDEDDAGLARLAEETEGCIAASELLRDVQHGMEARGTPLRTVFRYESLLCEDTDEQAGAYERSAYAKYVRTGRLGDAGVVRGVGVVASPSRGGTPRSKYALLREKLSGV
eukprot:TRINITY_DN22290_c0_g1_i1.p1 TRINITY_DN22290_c0_g1~~TRINITY_DN22290_c0_g1_i1.p1  ORF type:complete len:913 (+),score=251.16 TRINITY_DN22290_c0_g1_i1:77-2815(+)